MIKKISLALLFFAVAGIAACFLLFYLVKVEIEDHLSRAGLHHLSAIYSSYQVITERHPLSQESLLQILEERNYRINSYPPENPGEYSEQDGLLTIITRTFSDPQRSVSEPQIVEVDYKNGTINNTTMPHSRELVLEPVVLQPLGNSSQRASDVIPLSQMPHLLARLVVTIEDERFYDHSGIDPTGIARAFLANFRAGRIVQGGSTITQQLAKNLLFTPERTIQRKLREAVAALALEDLHTKDEILEMYLNEVYLGQEGNIAIHGMAEAARVFFEKELKDISVGEAALLAGIIRAPSHYSPRRNLDRALERRNVVLYKARELKVLSDDQLQKALKEKPVIKKSAHYKRSAPHYVSTLTSMLSDSIDITAAARTGAKIHTGLSVSLQSCAEKAVNEVLPQIQKKARRNKGDSLEVGLVSLEPYSGLVKAWIGGGDFGGNQFDHVYKAKRQMGSTIKPFLYLTALDEELNNYKVATPITILPDRPIKIEIRGAPDWIPSNFDKKYRGDVTLRYALENSLNVPAAYIATRFGVPALVNTLRKFSIASDIPTVPSLALGAVEADLLSVTAAYAALANGGIYVSPRLYVALTDSDGKSIFQSEISERTVSDSAPVYVLTNILMGVVDRGSARSIRRSGYEGIAAGKTGTSDDARDSWFIGYTPHLTTGVWVGYDNNAPTGLTGGGGAALIWAEYMKCAEDHVRNSRFIRPENVVMAEIDIRSRFQACPDTPASSRVTEAFVKGTEPEQRCYEPREYFDRFDREPQQSVPRPRSPSRGRDRNFWDYLFR